MMDSHKSYFRYIPVRQRDIQWGLYVTRMGCTKILPGAEYPPRTHPKPYDFTWQKGRTLPEYQVIYITAGEGLFESAPTGRKEVAAAAGFPNTDAMSRVFHRAKGVSPRAYRREHAAE